MTRAYRALLRAEQEASPISRRRQEGYVVRTYRSDTWDSYRMDYTRPHLVLEPLADEIAVVKQALTALHEAGVLPHTDYDHAKMLAHRRAVSRLFDIPWTAITSQISLPVSFCCGFVAHAILEFAEVFPTCKNQFSPELRLLLDHWRSYITRPSADHTDRSDVESGEPPC